MRLAGWQIVDSLRWLGGVSSVAGPLWRTRNLRGIMVQAVHCDYRALRPWHAPIQRSHWTDILCSVAVAIIEGERKVTGGRRSQYLFAEARPKSAKMPQIPFQRAHLLS